jgi:epoxyqueuosine reductase
MLGETGGGVGTRRSIPGLEPGEVAWPEGACSLLVIALEHPADQPEMDWWFGHSDPPGNRMLADIVQRLCDWIPESFGIQTSHLPYHVERGGTYLKDAAAAAGLGCIGRNNLLITREYGPRVRLRALTLDADLPSSGAVDQAGVGAPGDPVRFDPCAGCDAPCLRVCPQGAFADLIYDPLAPRLEELQGRLPGKTGHFSRAACTIQMEADIANAAEWPIAQAPGTGFGRPSAPAADVVKVIRYCRACELICPVGSPANLDQC